jgi:hypothetical protein
MTWLTSLSAQRAIGLALLWPLLGGAAPFAFVAAMWLRAYVVGRFTGGDAAFAWRLHLGAVPFAWLSVPPLVFLAVWLLARP